MIKIQDAATVGAFMMDGISENTEQFYRITGAWEDGGRIGLVLSMTNYARYLMALRDAGAKVFNDDYPGVFDYEVVCQFGKWFGDKVLLTGVPEPTHCRIWLLNAVLAYWRQNLNLPEDGYSDKSDELDAALMAVPFYTGEQS